LLNEKKTTRDAVVETVSEDCPKGVVDAEITQIASDKQCASDDLGVTGDVCGATSSNADREESRGVKLVVCVVA
jgi:hypothetical protein